jgi:hypothetical protein
MRGESAPVGMAVRVSGGLRGTGDSKLTPETNNDAQCCGRRENPTGRDR